MKTEEERIKELELLLNDILRHIEDGLIDLKTAWYFKNDISNTLQRKLN